MKLLKQALEYATNVIEDKEITTKEVKQQCKIFLADYNTNQYNEDFEFYFDENKLKIINNLLKLLNFATGFVAGKQVLENFGDYQAFLITAIFGWRFKNNPEKFKHNDVTLFIARKNAKTATVAIIFILLMLTEQNYSEFYSICLTRDLASEIKKNMAQIITASPLIAKYFTISKTKTGVITCNLTHSFFEPRVAEAGKNNSIRPCAFVSDEHANFSENSNFQAMKSGQKNVINPLVFRTTTAYAINNSIMESDIEYIKKVLNGKVDNKRVFALLYYADKENCWNDTGMYQANPLRIEDNYDTIRNDRERAKEKKDEVEEYLTKSMNIFLQEESEKKYIDLKEWKKCRVDKIDLEGKEVVVGCDFAISLDLNAISIMYQEKGKYYLKSHGFLPKDTLSERKEKIDYHLYERLGYCTLMEGRIADYDLIEEYIRSIESLYNCKIKLIISDPYNAIPTMKSLEKDYEVATIVQSYTQLSPSIKGFRDEVYKGNVIYEKNELLDWCVGNAVEQRAKVTEDILLAKEKKNKQRIDMLIASIYSFSQLYVKEKKFDINNYINEDYLKKLYG